MSKIEWTEQTWNPTLGCTEVSPGCLNCYAAKMAYRLAHIPATAEAYAGLTERLPNGRIVWTGKMRELPDRLQEPLKRKKPTIYFVDSMSDLFHDDITLAYLYCVFEVMHLSPQHTFQILTKREKNLGRLHTIYAEMQRNYPEETLPLKNVWIGVSIENQRYRYRTDYLIAAPAAKRFISAEPLIGPLEFDMYDLSKIDWIITGGESGGGARPAHPDWFRALRDQCKKSETAFFFKQHGAWLGSDQYAADGTFAPNMDGDVHVWPPHLHKPPGPPHFGMGYSINVGKDRAGSKLDNVEYKEIPI